MYPSSKHSQCRTHSSWPATCGRICCFMPPCCRHASPATSGLFLGVFHLLGVEHVEKAQEMLDLRVGIRVVIF